MNQVNPEDGTVVAANQQAFYDDMWRNYGHLDAVSPAAFHRRRIVVQLAAAIRRKLEEHPRRRLRPG